MKEYGFKINVGDILQNSSRTDTIRFSEKFSTFLPQLVVPGISCNIHIQGMDRSSVLLTISDACAHVGYVCDKCGQAYTDILSLPTRQLKCFFDDGIYEKEDEILYIHKKEKIIDIEEYLVESFFLIEEISRVCTLCGKKESGESDETGEGIGQLIHF